LYRCAPLLLGAAAFSRIAKRRFVLLAAYLHCRHPGYTAEDLITRASPLRMGNDG